MENQFGIDKENWEKLRDGLISLLSNRETSEECDDFNENDWYHLSNDILMFIISLICEVWDLMIIDDSIWIEIEGFKKALQVIILQSIINEF